MAKEVVSVRLDSEVLAKIDEVRGTRSRGQWVAAAAVVALAPPVRALPSAGGSRSSGLANFSRGGIGQRKPKGGK